MINYKLRISPQSFKREIINELYELKIIHRTLQIWPKYSKRVNKTSETGSWRSLSLQRNGDCMKVTFFKDLLGLVWSKEIAQLWLILKFIIVTRCSYWIMIKPFEATARPYWQVWSENIHKMHLLGFWLSQKKLFRQRGLFVA